jgi:hypothetical protein
MNILDASLTRSIDVTGRITRGAVRLTGRSAVGVLHGATRSLRRLNAQNAPVEADQPVIEQVAPEMPQTPEPVREEAPVALVPPPAELSEPEPEIARVIEEIHTKPLVIVERDVMTSVGADGKRRRDQTHGREARLLAEEQISRRRNVTLV